MRAIVYGLCMAGLGLTLGGCDMFEPKPDVSTMSMSELQTAIAQGGERSAEKLRLSKMYASYGTDVQKREAFDMLAPMADGGNSDAAVGLCAFTDNEEFAQSALSFCQMEADRGVMRAQIPMCIHIGQSTSPGNNPYCRAAADKGETVTYLYEAYNLAYDQKWDEARMWLEKAIIEGPPSHRDDAIDIMINVVREKAGDNPYYTAQAAPNRKRVAFEVIQAEGPTSLPKLSRDAQCFVKWTVTPTGLASRVNIECNNPALERPVREAVHGWRFKPSTKGGIPIFDSVRATTTLRFSALNR